MGRRSNEVNDCISTIFWRDCIIEGKSIHRNNKLKTGAYLRWGLTEYLLNLKSTNCVDCTLDGAFS
jgi:hypothetical protein